MLNLVSFCVFVAKKSSPKISKTLNATILFSINFNNQLNFKQTQTIYSHFFLLK